MKPIQQRTIQTRENLPTRINREKVEDRRIVVNAATNAIRYSLYFYDKNVAVPANAVEVAAPPATEQTLPETSVSTPESRNDKPNGIGHAQQRESIGREQLIADAMAAADEAHDYQLPA